ncbi:MAG TPA: ATP-binding protein [Candidatus Cloacimonadota bacterium]|nr:ATP-binding protein [Candidatus Cloacimonadota bacterium]HPT73010.1 ATP-binding protein [Candidatus Cloacimonadota bacterium]
MQDLSLHLLDIIENSARAEAKLIEIRIDVDEVSDRMKIFVRDNGTGMDSKTLAMAQDPFYTSKMERVKKVGLGIPLFKQNVEQWNGSFLMKSELGKGTELFAEFQASNIDRIPLGNIRDTLLGSIIGHPEIDFQVCLKHEISGANLHYEFDTIPLREELGDIPITYPDVISYIENDINEGIQNTKMEEI